VNRQLAIVFLFALSTIGFSPLHAQQFGRTMNQQWKDFLGLPRESGDYTWFGYPVDNFGVITVYGPPARANHLADSDRLCATWSCLGISAAQIPSDDTLYITVRGNADSGKGPQVHIENNNETKALASLLISNLLSVLKIDGAVTFSRSSKVTINIGAVYKRSINHLQFDPIANDQKGRLYDYFHNSDNSYIGADIVLHDVQMKIELTSNSDARAKATLDKVQGPFGADSNAGGQVTKTGDSSYLLSFSKFLVLATQRRQVPTMKGAQFSAKEDAPAFVLFNPTAVQPSLSVPMPEVDQKTLKLTKP